MGIIVGLTLLGCRAELKANVANQGHAVGSDDTAPRNDHDDTGHPPGDDTGETWQPSDSASPGDSAGSDSGGADSSGDTAVDDPLAGLTACSADSPNSYCLMSEDGDWVGAGTSWWGTPSDGDLAADYAYETGNALTLGWDGNDGTWWYFSFEAPHSEPLAVGVYEGAVRFPFNTDREAGLDVSGEGRGCNTLDGTFEVVDIETSGIGAQPTLDAVRVRFIQHCEGGEPELDGEVWFDSTP